MSKDLLIQKTKPYHKSGMWTLYGTNKEKSRVMHLCRVKKTKFNQHGVGETIFILENNLVSPHNFQCHNCNSIAPNDIQALFRLHNMEEVERRDFEHGWVEDPRWKKPA